MGDTEIVGLSRLKESVAPTDVDRTPDTRAPVDYYPFALVLRLRVLQIVFGIVFLIIGTVAFIEEKGTFNLGLGIPTGAMVILAAGASIHTTRGFGGYRASTHTSPSIIRFLGPTAGIAASLTILWVTACSLLTILLVKAIKTLDYAIELSKINGCDLLILAIVEVSLALLTLCLVFVHLRVDCKYDPD